MRKPLLVLLLILGPVRAVESVGAVAEIYD
jgi:hypothetical protein